MNEMNEVGILQTLAGWPVRMRVPAGDGPHPVILLLHGWTGDENSMWFFAPRLPANHLLVAPRGIFATQPTGYSWRAITSEPPSAGGGALPALVEFQGAVSALAHWMTPEHFPQADFSRLYLIGFSQGAALSYAFALLQPEKVSGLVALAGFAPVGAQSLAEQRPLLGKDVLIAHGQHDRMIPIEQARQAFKLMQLAGAEVTYCEDDVGHKMGARCFPHLETFFAKSWRPSKEI